MGSLHVISRLTSETGCNFQHHDSFHVSPLPHENKCVLFSRNQGRLYFAFDFPWFGVQCQVTNNSELMRRHNVINSNKSTEIDLSEF